MPVAAAPVVILGGGLTGISTAYHLGSGYVLLEREARLGGHARTEERDGYFFDRTGHWLHLRDPGIRRLITRLLPGGLTTVDRRARVYSSGVLTRYPFQANLFGLPPAVAAECLLGLVETRLAAPDPGPPRDFEQFCLRHFGAGIAKHFMIPYNSKLYGVHPREITAEWCQRFVPVPKLEEVVRGAVGEPPPEMGYNVGFLYPKRGGIETMTRALTGRLTGDVRTGTAPDAIDLKRREVVVRGQRVPFRAIVSTIPLPAVCRLIQGAPRRVLEAADQLRCTPLRYLNVATRHRPPADFHWIYVPEERYPFYRVGIYSNAVPSMAPRGRGALYVELSERGPLPPARRLTAEVARGLAAAGAIRDANDVLFADLRELEHAYVIFDHAYYAATRFLRSWLEQRGIYPRGRYGFWTYNSMEDCLIAGRDVAQTVVQGGALPAPPRRAEPVEPPPHRARPARVAARRPA
ncbi:MAG TPA: FAD-dependent oxidoreductase [Polyangia bacterium]|jgi:protoporphyrinogen oxidase